MASDEKSGSTPRPGRGSVARSTQGKTVIDRPFDMWLQKQLHAMYDEIAAEPLPSDLLNLIDRDAAEGRNNDQSTDKKPGGKKA